MTMHAVEEFDFITDEEARFIGPVMAEERAAAAVAAGWESVRCLYSGTRLGTAVTGLRPKGGKATVRTELSMAMPDGGHVAVTLRDEERAYSFVRTPSGERYSPRLKLADEAAAGGWKPERWVFPSADMALLIGIPPPGVSAPMNGCWRAIDAQKKEPKPMHLFMTEGSQNDRYRCTHGVLHGMCEYCIAPREAVFWSVMADVPCDLAAERGSDASQRALSLGWSKLRWVKDIPRDCFSLVGVKPPEKSEPKHAWLEEGEAVAFSTGEYSPDWPQKPDAVDKAAAHGWTGLRWVDDRDRGLFHLVGKRPSQKADAAATYPVDTEQAGKAMIALQIKDVPMFKAVQREQDMDELRKREAKQPLNAPKSTDLARAELVDAFNEWARNAHCTRQEWDVIREDIRAALWGRVQKEAPAEPELEPAKAPSDGSPCIRSELGGLMGPGYQATGYEPPPRRQVLLDDPTGDDIAGDVP